LRLHGRGEGHHDGGALITIPLRAAPGGLTSLPASTTPASPALAAVPAPPAPAPTGASPSADRAMPRPGHPAPSRSGRQRVGHLAAPGGQGCLPASACPS